MILFSLILAALASYLFGSCDASRFPRRAGDQAPNGNCEMFKWGGNSNLHWYACCNNCNDTDVSCNGKTYQSASSGVYCDACGIDNKKGNGNKNGIFVCGGCTGQDKVQKVCTSKLRTIYNIPGFCWAFAKCFRNKCKKRGHSSSLTFAPEDPVPDSCFNLICDTGENVNNCPIDCCGTVTKKCDWANYQNTTNHCPPECCGDSSCCSGGHNLSVSVLLWTIIMAVGKLLFN